MGFLEGLPVGFNPLILVEDQEASAIAFPMWLVCKNRHRGGNIVA